MTWSVNGQAAKAVALYGPGTPAERRELLEMLGLIAEDRSITPDDNRIVDLGGLDDTATTVERVKMTGREPGMDRSLVPVGLRDLPPAAAQPKRKTEDRDRCGSLTGATVHRRHGEEVCRRCKDARNAYQKSRRQEMATGGPTSSEPCGSIKGRTRHLRNKEPLCRECKDAYNAHQRAKRAQRVIPEAKSA